MLRPNPVFWASAVAMPTARLTAHIPMIVLKLASYDLLKR
jgi:hypothetical protein